MARPLIRIKHEGFKDGVLINADLFDPETMEQMKEPKGSAKKKSKTDADETESEDETDPESTTPNRCKFIKGDGDQCANNAKKDSEFCYIKSHK